MTSRRLVLVAVGVIVTACTSNTHGAGPSSRAGNSVSSSPSPGSTATASVGSTGSTPPATSTAATLPPQLVRSPVSTAIGDPGTADLCAAIGLAPFADLGTASYDPVQYPPGCSITLSDGNQPVLTVSIFAARHKPAAAEGRGLRTASQLPVFTYPFNGDTGGCERDVVAQHVRLVADAISRGPAKPDQHLSCAATDAMANRAAEVATRGSVPRLSRAEPSVFDLDACDVVEHAGIRRLTDFASAELVRRGFAVNCEVSSETVFLFINAALAASTPPPRSTPVTIDGHHLDEIASRPGFCSYASVQGTTADGDHEEITAAATVPGARKPPAHLCDQTAQALALYLTTAGLG